MPTFVSLASASPAMIRRSLSIFIVVIFLIYLLGALLFPETRDNFH